MTTPTATVQAEARSFTPAAETFTLVVAEEQSTFTVGGEDLTEEVANDG